MSESIGEKREPHRRDDPAGAVVHAGGRRTDPLFSGMAAMCATAVRAAKADGAAVAVLTRSTRIRELVYATDPIAQRLDELQYISGEGPCFDAYLDDSPQFHPDLRTDAQTSRWPTFAADAEQLGVRALFAFPIPGGKRPVGVLELYRRAGGGLDAAERDAATAISTAIAQRLEANWERYVARAGSAERAISTAAYTTAQNELGDPFTRSQIHVAAGMVAQQLKASSAEGVDRLRAYSHACGRSISSVAADIVARRLSLRVGE